MNTCFPRAIRSAIAPSHFAFYRRSHRISLSNHVNRPSSFLAFPSVFSKPQTPLFLRHPAHSTTLTDLQKFHAWATDLIFSRGSHFQATDNGPGTDILCRELRWLLEDSVSESSMLCLLDSSKSSNLMKSNAEYEHFSLNSHLASSQNASFRAPNSDNEVSSADSHLGSNQNPGLLKSSSDSEDFCRKSHLGSPQNPSFLRPNGESEDFSMFSRLVSSQNPSFLQSDNRLDYLSMSSHSDSSENGRMIKLKISLEQLYSLWKERIEKRRPFQYIVGCEHWRDMVLSVEEGVLIPRPETELIVDMVGQVIFDNDELGAGVWADLGSGSGAIGIGIGRILAEAGRVIATDVSAMAVAVAKFNVERYGLQDKVEVRHGSWFEPLQDIKGKLAGLISNPPYIPSHQISGLQAEVGRHEPRIALDGGENGMDNLLHLCEGSVFALKPGGFFAFETNGDEQSEFIADIMSSKSNNSFRDVNIESDYSGIRRFVTGFRR